MSSTKLTGVKASAREAIEQLPDDASWDDVMYRIYVRQKIEAGLQDVAEGRTVSTSEVRKQFGLSE